VVAARSGLFLYSLAVVVAVQVVVVVPVADNPGVVGIQLLAPRAFVETVLHHPPIVTSFAPLLLKVVVAMVAAVAAMTARIATV